MINLYEELLKVSKKITFITHTGSVDVPIIVEFITAYKIEFLRSYCRYEMKNVGESTVDLRELPPFITAAFVSKFFEDIYQSKVHYVTTLECAYFANFLCYDINLHLIVDTAINNFSKGAKRFGTHLFPETENKMCSVCKTEHIIYKFDFISLDSYRKGIAIYGLAFLPIHGSLYEFIKNNAEIQAICPNFHLLFTCL